MKNHYTGRVVFVGRTESLGKNPDKPFYKRVIVVDDADAGAKYPNPCQFEATGDKCQYLDRYEVGDTVTIEFFLTGREYTGKDGQTRYFTSNRISYIRKGGCDDDADDAVETPVAAETASADSSDTCGDALPF